MSSQETGQSLHQSQREKAGEERSQQNAPDSCRSFPHVWRIFVNKNPRPGHRVAHLADKQFLHRCRGLLGDSFPLDFLQRQYEVVRGGLRIL